MRNSTGRRAAGAGEAKSNHQRGTRVLAEAAHDTKTAEMEQEREKLHQAGKPYRGEP